MCLPIYLCETSCLVFLCMSLLYCSLLSCCIVLYISTLHVLVFVLCFYLWILFSLKIRAEEDQEPVRENTKEKEVDPCAMMMDTTMFDETNPMMEWLNEDEENIILDGAEAATAVFEKIRSLNTSKKASHLGRKDIGRKRKRTMEEEEDDFIDCEDEDEETEYNDIDDDHDGEHDSASESDGRVPSQVEKDIPNQAENEVEVTSDGSLANRRSGRVRQSKKVKDVNSLYY